MYYIFFVMSCLVSGTVRTPNSSTYHRTIDYALDTLYEPNAVFRQSASMIFFFLFSFPCFLLSRLFLLFLSFLSFPFSLFSLPCFFFPFLYLLLFSSFFFSNWLASVVRMRSDRYYVQCIRGSLSWVASGIAGFSRLE